MPLLMPSGGLVYHARALRHANREWRPFRRDIGAWLDAWRPPTSRLVLVGPSGGYTLPTTWLQRFERIVAVDFDPLARAFFALRHGTRAGWLRDDLLPTHPEGIDLRPLERLLDAHPGDAVLFSNVLGQVAIAAPDDDAVERDLHRLRRRLEGRHWASYHDRLSADREPSCPLDRAHRNDRDLAACAFGSGEVSSHSTQRLGEGLECASFAWRLSRRRWHLIEGCVGLP